MTLFYEKLLLEATLEVLEKNLVVGLQDMGAAGLTSSIFEMASRGQTGVKIDLEKVPTRTSQMTPYELMLSESQERMLMVVDPKNKKALEAVFKHWDLAYDQIGIITDSSKVEAFFYNEKHIDIPVAPLVEKAPLYDRVQEEPVVTDNEPDLDEQWLSKCKGLDIKDLIQDLYLDKVLHEPIYSQYDYDIGLKTIIGPNRGGAAILELQSFEDPNDTVSIAVTANCLESICRVDPKEGAKQSVYKTARTLIASGATPLATTDCLNYGNPEDPEVMWQFAQGVEGIKEACLELKSPVVSGNVSLYNETEGKSIAPTPMLGMVGLLKDKKFAKPAISNQTGVIYLLTYKEDYLTLVGSPLARILDLRDKNKKVPEINKRAEEESKDLVLRLCELENVLAIRDIDRQGILVSLLKMNEENKDLITYCQDVNDLRLYLGSLVGGYLIHVAPEYEEDFLEFRTELSFNKLMKVAELIDGEGLVSFNELSFNPKDIKAKQKTISENLF